MHRIITQNAAGQVRTIEYASRREALKYFSILAGSQQTHSATLQKQRPYNGDMPEHPNDNWQEVATMRITPQNDMELPE